MCAVAGTLFPQFQKELAVGFTASLATKLSDTTASEIGKAYGKTTYLSTTFRKVPRGTEGAVSLEGTLAGAAASVVLTAYACAVGLVPWWPAAPACVVAAFVGTTFESFLGASIQGKVKFLTNEFVNFLNTFVGGLCGALLVMIVK